jgi:DHA1 family tetracycline resistance protein-like MFS transporter
MIGLVKRQIQENWSILKHIRGNARACLITEPMWGIPFNLYIPYASVYMLALGCTDTQVGIVISVGLAFQMFFSLVGGYITDKLGRRRTTLIFDLIGWSVPTLIWALARNFNYFLAAAMVNAVFRIVYTSWTCLLVEDTQPSRRVHVYTWIYVAGILAGFFSPIAGALVGRFTLVPAVRGLYALAFLSMTSMFFIRNALTRETKTGLRKMEEVKEFRLRETLLEYRRITSSLLKSPLTLIAFSLVIIKNIHITIKQTFLAILLIEGLDFPKEAVALFPAIHSVVMLLVFLFIMPTLGRLGPKRPLLWGFLTLIAGYLTLVFSPHKSYSVVVLSTVLTAFGTAVVFPFSDALMHNTIYDSDRAKIISILHVFLFAVSAPFGYIGGLLSSLAKQLPFVLLAAVQLAGVVLLGLFALCERRHKSTGRSSLQQ